MDLAEHLIADLVDGDRRDESDLEERAAYGIVVFSDGRQEIDVMPHLQPAYDPFERDTTMEEADFWEMDEEF